MGKIFEFSGGSYIDKVSGVVGTNTNGEIIRGDKGLVWKGNGVDSKIELSSTIALGTTYTFSIWYKYSDSVHTYSSFAGYSDVSYPLTLNQSNKTLYVNDGTSNTSEGRTDMKKHEWNHLLITKNGTSVYFYVNGIKGVEKTIATNSPISFDVLFVRNTALWTKGDCANIRAWTHILTSEEIAKEYSEFLNSFPITRTIQ